MGARNIYLMETRMKYMAVVRAKHPGRKYEKMFRHGKVKKNVKK